MQKIGNFNCNTIETMFQLEGYQDMYNIDADQLTKFSTITAKRKNQGVLEGGKRTYDFIFVPNSGFLNSNLPLLNDCELKLSFDRVNAEISLLKPISTVVTDDLKGSPIKIKDCYAITEYISSEYYRNFFSRIDTQPIQYKFDECDITLKALPLNVTEIRLDNIRGGNNPECIFLAIASTSAINGDFEKSSVGFHHNDVETVSITLNGRTVNGYPIDIKNESPVNVMQKFFDVTNRFMNPLTGECPTFSSFKSNWIYAHKFEAEATSQGWLGVHLKLSSALTTSHTLVIWSVNSSAITIDKFHQIEKILL